MTRAWRIVIAVGALLAATLVIQLDLRGMLPGQIHIQIPDTMLVAAPSTGQSSQDDQGAQLPAAAAAPNAARVTMSIQPSATAGHGYVLQAEVRTPAGAPAGDATVGFYETVQFLGPREELLGSATTDAQGNASFTYLPATTGSHAIVARTSGIAKAATGEGRSTLEATVSAPLYRPDIPAITAFQNVVPYGVGAMVLSVWLLIAFALIGTARGVARGARGQKEKGVIA